MSVVTKEVVDIDREYLRVRRVRHTHSVGPRIRPGVCSTGAHCSRPSWVFVALPDGVMKGDSPVAPQRGHAAGAVVGPVAACVSGSVVVSVADSVAGAGSGVSWVVD